MTALTARTALVTGAASGIGAGVAQHLASLGYRVGLLDRDHTGVREVANALCAAGGQALAVRADVSDETEVHAAVSDLRQELGEAEILVNNAGFARDSNLVAMPTEDWDAVIATHLRGTYLLTRAVLPSMQRRRFGRIVNISSISALGHAGRANYIAAKGGIEAFTKAVAHEVARDGITVNAIGPGVIVTKMTELGARRAGRSLADHIEVLRQSVPVGRVGAPHDIARTVAFFAADDADFITGQIIYVSGGPHG
jgi:3-oxoacyl-[acyl-carrier protein] reductase